tara:strand:- start:220 stop:672 length:453 start_codon:yes stop_codon:yes gene_type:complete
MPIKTFRGRLADTGVEQIRLSTNQGLIGYKIKKFQAMPEEPGQAVGEHTLQLFTQKPDDDPYTDTTVDFTNPLLIGVVSLSTHSGNLLYNEVIIFDNVKFNQDIYITHTDKAGSANCNYHVELEQVKLTLDEATVATLKDMRGNYTNQDP